MESKRHGNKRNSGIFSVQGQNVQRHMSGKAPSADRRGQVYPDDPKEATVQPTERPSTPNMFTWESRQRPKARGHAEHPSPDRVVAARPRTRTLDERWNEQPAAADNVSRRRNRHGSLQSTGPLPLHDSSESIGFPSIMLSHSQQRSRQRLVKPGPRPISPVVDLPTMLPQPVAVGEAERILQLMKATCGRMHGILHFRTSKSSQWSSGYCAINVATGSLIYQMKGEVSHAQTLIPDLRGCRVRTQVDDESGSSFLEVHTHSSEPGIHLRPLVVETLDSWLAALLCWQPLRSQGALTKMIRPQTAVAPDRRAGSRRSNSVISLNKDAAIIKVSKMLWWDHDACLDAPSTPTRRLSTYKQQRLAASTPWQKVSCTLHENGYLKTFLESDTSLVSMIPLTSLSRHAVQRLHPSVLDDEYCIAIYPRYTNSKDFLGYRQPVYLSLESRVLFEVWFLITRAFTVPDVYGPERPSLSQAVDLRNGEWNGHGDSNNNNNNSNLFRIEKHLYLRIVEGKVHKSQSPTEPKEHAGPKTGLVSGQEPLPGEYCAEVHLDGEIRGRTAVKSNTSNPFWREDYELLDLPPALSSVSILLKARCAGPRDWTLVSNGQRADVDNLGSVGDLRISLSDTVYGTIDLRLDDLQRGIDTEKWFPVYSDTDELVGQILMRARIEETVVLMSDEYLELSGLLHAFSNGLTQEIAASCSSEMQKLYETLVNIFQVSGKVAEWIMSLVEDEIDGHRKHAPIHKYRFSRRVASNDSYDSAVDREVLLRDLGKAATSEANLLFRGNSLLTKALDFHMRRLGREYLEEVLGEQLRDIDESDPGCEVDPNRVRHSSDLQRNWRNLIALTENMWKSIAASATRCHPELRLIFRHIRACAEDRYGDFLRTVKYSSVSGFLFLRLFCPAVLNPKLFGLLKDHPRPRAQRTLTLIAKSLQTLANMTTFGSKEPWMEPMNAFLMSHRQEFKEFVDSVCAISHDRPLSAISPSYATPMALIHRLPRTSCEGFLSLPYLIDQTKELATLVNIWAETRTVEKEGREDTHATVARFDELCTKLRVRTRDCLKLAQQAERPGGPPMVKWEELIDQVDGKLRLGADQPRAVVRRPLPPARNFSSFSTVSYDMALPIHDNHDILATTIVDSSSEKEFSQARPGSASGVDDAVAQRQESDTPSAAVAPRSGSWPHNNNNILGMRTNSDSPTPALQASMESSTWSLAVDNSYLRDRASTLNADAFQPISPREGRRFTDIWAAGKAKHKKKP